jgi:hypothetical protein
MESEEIVIFYMYYLCMEDLLIRQIDADRKASTDYPQGIGPEEFYFLHSAVSRISKAKIMFFLKTSCDHVTLKNLLDAKDRDITRRDALGYLWSNRPLKENKDRLMAYDGLGKHKKWLIESTFEDHCDMSLYDFFEQYGDSLFGVRDGAVEM